MWIYEYKCESKKICEIDGVELVATIDNGGNFSLAVIKGKLKATFADALRYGIWIIDGRKLTGQEKIAVRKLYDAYAKFICSRLDVVLGEIIELKEYNHGRM
jgi:hypothetical protein